MLPNSCVPSFLAVTLFKRKGIIHGFACITGRPIHFSSWPQFSLWNWVPARCNSQTRESAELRSHILLVSHVKISLNICHYTKCLSITFPFCCLPSMKEKSLATSFLSAAEMKVTLPHWIYALVSQPSCLGCKNSLHTVSAFWSTYVNAETEAHGAEANCVNVFKVYTPDALIHTCWLHLLCWPTVLGSKLNTVS